MTTQTLPTSADPTASGSPRPSQPGSRLPGFYQMPLGDRIALIGRHCGLDEASLDRLRWSQGLSPEEADKMVENALGVLALPFALGLNFLVNGREFLVPMAIEEASVVASASYSAKLVRDGGGFTAGSTERTMIGQVQLLDCEDPHAAAERLTAATAELLQAADTVYPSLVRRGGGARGLEVRVVDLAPAGLPGAMVVAHFLVDTRDAMGANILNTMMEGVAPRLEQLTGGRAHLKILSNLADRCRAWAECRVPAERLRTGDLEGPEVVDRIVEAWAFAACDPYRATTHNKGVMNGIDAVVMATGNDWRAIEAGCHAYAAREGRYAPLTRWWKDEEGDLRGRIEVPMAVGTVGGVLTNPGTRLAHRILGNPDARTLAEVVVSVGLAQNLAAIKALATEGIQKGHMALHARNVALAAGARGDQVDAVAEAMIRASAVRLSMAEEILRQEAEVPRKARMPESGERQGTEAQGA